MRPATIPSLHTHGCPCDRCAARSDAFIAYAEQHGTEPEECRDCLALVDAVDGSGRCEDCSTPPPSADLPVSIDDFSNPAPIGFDEQEAPF